MNKVYIVMGATGEYSDSVEWPVAAYLNEGLAIQRVLDCTRRAKEIEAARESRYTRPKDGQNEFDADMQMDYTGTSYFVSPVDLEDG